MYTIEFKRKGVSNIVQIHCTTENDLSKMISFIESHPDIDQFKIFEPVFAIENIYTRFGWGRCEKFVTEFDWRNS